MRDADGPSLLSAARGIPSSAQVDDAPILFLLSPEVSGTSGTMSIYIYIYIYIYICQQHGGLLGGSRSRWYYSVNFVSLLLFSSTKNL